MVLDKKHLDKGMTADEKQCSVSDTERFFKLPATEPYLPRDCEALDVPDLTSAEFHVFVEGKEQRIQAVTAEGEYVLVRDHPDRS
jgi:hypothetical protein